MRKRRPGDASQAAWAVVQEATGQAEPADPYEGKDHSAVERGRLGGVKGDKARASKLTPEQRSEIAKRAAAARWATKRES